MKRIRKFVEIKDDSAIWDNFRNGHEETRVYLFEAYVSKLFRYGLSIKYDTDLVKDCIQIVYERLIKKCSRLGPTDNIELYLRKCLKTEMLKQLKRHHAEIPESELNEEEKFHLIYYPDYSNDESMPSPPTPEVINQAIEQLTCDHQEVIKLRKEGFSYKWIAKKLGITVANSRKRVERARKALMKRLDNLGAMSSF